VARNPSVVRLGSLCFEAHLAAQMTSEGIAEARNVRSDLRRFGLAELDPDPAEASPFVDDRRSPFADLPMADRYLRGVPSEGDVAHLAVPGTDTWDQHHGYVAARTFRVVQGTGTDALPGLAVFGKGDGMADAERAERIRACLQRQQPFAAIDPLDNIETFLAIDGEERYASAAIVALDRSHVAVSVATGRTVAVGTHHNALVRSGGKWVPVRDLRRMPIFPASVSAPLYAHDRTTPAWPLRHGRAQQIERIFAESGNSILLNGVVLGGVEAGYQPDCAPCEAAAMYIAAAAGCVMLKASTGRFLARPYQVRAMLINALLKGEKVPGLIAARHEFAAHRCLADLRNRTSGV
jgi:hypothetical protein